MPLKVPFSAAVHGDEIKVQVPRRATCDSCDGSGAAAGTERTTCTACRGAGQVRLQQGLFTIQTPCRRCAGAGSVVATPCDTCGGQGLVRETKELNVKVPAGVETGNRMRYRNEGEAGANGGPNGDLYIVLQVEDSELFERDGADLHLPLPIHYAQAVLGGTVDVPTLEGDESVDFKAGTQHGDTHIIRGQGLPRVGRKERGNLIIHFRIDVPRKVSKRERELLEELAEIGNAETRQGFFTRVKDFFDPKQAKSSEQ